MRFGSPRSAVGSGSGVPFAVAPSRTGRTSFDAWTAGAPVTWAALPVTAGRVTITSIAGVSPGPAVRIRFADGSVELVPATRTATDRTARFFGVVLAGSLTVRDVTVLDAAGHPIGAAVRDPGSPCRPGPSVGCAEPVPNRTPGG